jgi:uncharacterized protein YkwD
MKKFVSLLLILTFLVSMPVVALASSVWTPEMPLPVRRLTTAELNAWRQSYDAVGVSPIELEILRLTNVERQKAGLAPFGLYQNLFRAARFKSQEMRDLDYYAHDSPVYGRFTGIMGLFVPTLFVSLGENIMTSGGT